MTEQMSANPEEVDRRKFLTGIIGVVAGAVAVVVGVPTIGYLVSPGVKQANAEKWITLGPINSLTPGVPTGFPFSRSIKDGWVESTQTGVAYALTYDGQNVLVLSDVCTHLSCRVTWHEDRQRVRVSLPRRLFRHCRQGRVRAAAEAVEPIPVQG